MSTSSSVAWPYDLTFTDSSGIALPRSLGWAPSVLLRIPTDLVRRLIGAVGLTDALRFEP